MSTERWFGYEYTYARVGGRGAILRRGGWGNKRLTIDDLPWQEFMQKTSASSLDAPDGDGFRRIVALLNEHLHGNPDTIEDA